MSDLARLQLRCEQDVAHARQRARLIAELLGFERIDQTRISTVVSGIARNAVQYGGARHSLEGGSVQASLSLGIAIFHDDGTDMASLLLRADQAMYCAKQAGRNAYQFCAPKLEDEPP